MNEQMFIYVDLLLYYSLIACVCMGGHHTLSDKAG